MTALAPAPTPDATAPAEVPRGSLLRAEVRRFRSRRFIQVLLALTLAGFVLAVGLAAATEYGNPTPAALAEAQARVDAAVVEQEGYRQQCLADPGRPAGVDATDYCGPATTAENIPIGQFLDEEPFVLADALPPGGIAAAVVTAALAFLIGATWVGAEWSSRSMVALLFWVPRRTAVMRAKLTVLVAATALLGVVAQALWWGTALLLAATLGRATPLPDDFYADLLGQQARSVLLVVLVGLLGFGFSNLMRGTGAALGVGFLYFAIVENAVRNLRPSWQEWLLTDNAAALVLPGGNTLYLYDESFVDPTTGFTGGGRELVLSNLHGGLVLGFATAALVAVGVVVFARRDLH